MPRIEACSVSGVTYKSGSLPSSLSVADVTRVLGFGPNATDDPDKVENAWEFTVDDSPCMIWDYNGVRWSTFDPDHKLYELFNP